MTTKNNQNVVTELLKSASKETSATLSDDGILYEEPIIYRFTEQEITQLVKEVEAGERERLENEFGDFAHEHYKGCVREADSTYTYGYDNEVIWLVREFFEKENTTPPTSDVIEK